MKLLLILLLSLSCVAEIVDYSDCKTWIEVQDDTFRLYPGQCVAYRFIPVEKITFISQITDNKSFLDNFNSKIQYSFVVCCGPHIVQIFHYLNEEDAKTDREKIFKYYEKWSNQ